MNFKNKQWIFLILCAGIGLKPDQAGAQSVALEPNSGAGVHLEAVRLSWVSHSVTSASSAYFLSARLPAGNNLLVRTELPYVIYQVQMYGYGYDYYHYEPESGNGFGNPYVGLDVGDPDRGVQWEFGLRLPVIKEFFEPAMIAASTDYIERLEAFAVNVLPVYLGFNYRIRKEGGFGMRLRTAPVFIPRVGDSSDVDPDLHILYSAQMWYENTVLGTGGGLTGRYAATGEGDGFGENSLHEILLFLNFSFGRLLPGAQLRIPLDEFRWGEPRDPTYSLSLGWKL